MISLLLGLLLCLISSANAADQGEETALARLLVTTDVLVSFGDEIAGEPMSGMLVLKDTVSIDLSISSEYTYQLVMWTESTFNFVDFWLTNPQGEVPASELIDHAAFAINPNSTQAGIWKLQMELLEGANSDTAYYAVGLLRRDKDTPL